jgi:hypothetical protein
MADDAKGGASALPLILVALVGCGGGQTSAAQANGAARALSSSTRQIFDGGRAPQPDASRHARLTTTGALGHRQSRKVLLNSPSIRGRLTPRPRSWLRRAVCIPPWIATWPRFDANRICMER